MARRKMMRSVYLTEQQVQDLEDLHAATQVPTAVRFRAGVDQIIAEYKGVIEKYRSTRKRAYKAE